MLTLGDNQCGPQSQSPCAGRGIVLVLPARFFRLGSFGPASRGTGKAGKVLSRALAAKGHARSNRRQGGAALGGPQWTMTRDIPAGNGPGRTLMACSYTPQRKTVRADALTIFGQVPGGLGRFPARRRARRRRRGGRRDLRREQVGN